MTHPFKTKPFSHQREVWDQSKDLASFAVFWEQGTGKTKVTIDTLAHQYLSGLVDTLLVVAPGGVDRNWITDELPAHLPDEIAAQMMSVNFKTKKSATKWHQQELAQLVHHKGLAVLTISYDAFVSKSGKQAVWNLMRGRKVFMVLDEAHAIKTPSAQRTKAILGSGKYVSTKRILTGTPVAQGPFDIFSQMKFLDEDFWKKRGIYTFTAQLCGLQPRDALFLGEDESYVICPDAHGGIECGMHGHLGINGAKPSPLSLSKMGRKANTAHTHSAAIVDGMYVAGTSTKLEVGYNKGPGSWSQSHIVTYPSGKRAIVTIQGGKWRA